MFPPRPMLAAFYRCSGIRPIRQIPHRHTLPRYQRPFSGTTRAQAASGDIAAFTAAFQKTAIFKKIADNPEALEALQDFARIFQNAGIDLTSGKRPSSLQMMKLAANSEFRNGMKRVAEELQKAGIDMSSPEVMNEIMSLKKVAEDSK